MGMMKLAIMGVIVIILLITLVQPFMIILQVISPLFKKDILVGVLGLVGIVVIGSFFWFAGSVLNG